MERSGTLSPPGSDAPVSGFLLQRFFEVAGSVVNRAAQQDAPQKLPPEFDRLLEGIVVLAKHRPLVVLKEVEGWRREQMRAVNKAAELNKTAEDFLLQTSKRVAIEKLHFLIILSLMRKGLAVPEKNAQVLQELSFTFIAGIDTLVPNELASKRSSLLRCCKELLGELSRTRLLPILRYFQEQVAARVRDAASTSSTATKSRAEILSLCSGLHHLRLTFTSNIDVSYAVEALTLLNPLQAVQERSLQKKSQVHHAYCGLLEAILMPVADQGISNLDRLDPEVKSQFFRKARLLMNELWMWIAKSSSKHQQAGYPVLTQLMRILLQSNDFQMKEYEVFVDKLQKMLRDKIFSDTQAQRTLGLTALAQCIPSYLQIRGAGLTVDKREKQLHVFVNPILVAAKKGTFSQHANQLALLRQLAMNCMPFAPRYTAQTLLPALLDVDSWEIVNVGLGALRAVLLQAWLRLRQAPLVSAYTPDKPLKSAVAEQLAAGSGNDEDNFSHTLDLIRRGSHPLELHGVADKQACLAKPLAKVLSTLWNTYGGRHTAATDTPSASSQRMCTTLTLRVFHSALQLLPIFDDVWGEGDAPHRLALLTLNQHSSLRKCAHHVLCCLTNCRPALRNVLLAEVCALAHRVPCDSATHSDVLSTALALTKYWRECLARDAELKEEERHADDEAAVDVATLEGFGILSLCSPVPAVRKLGLQLLNEVRNLDIDQTKHKPGALSQPAQRTYAATVLEQAGDAVVRENYWNFGSYSQLCRVHKAVPPRVSFESVLGTPDLVRWSNLLPHLQLHLAVLCPDSVQRAYEQMSMHLSSMLRCDHHFRSVSLAADSREDWARIDHWRSYVAFMASVPPYPSDRRPANVVSGDELRSHLVSVLRAGSEQHMPWSGSALGHCHVEHIGPLLSVLVPLYKEALFEAARKSTRHSRQSVPMCIAHVIRFRCDFGLPPSLLADDPSAASRLSDFLTTTLNNVANPAPGMFWDAHELRHCVCAIVCTLGGQTEGPKGPPLDPLLRCRLWDAAGAWLGFTGSQEERALGRAQSAILSRIKDPEARAREAADMQDLVEALQLSAMQAMATLLGGQTWSNQMTQHGDAFPWFDTMFASTEPQVTSLLETVPSRAHIARRALRRFLLSNPALCPAALEQCYLADSRLADSYFAVLAEVCVALHAAGRAAELGDAHKLVSLVLHKVAHPDANVRSDALSVLRVVAESSWGHANSSKSGADVVVVIGQLQDSYQLFQVDLSTRLAGEYPDMAEALCEEILTRQLDSQDLVTQHHVLQCLRPWMDHLEFTKQWDGTITERLLSRLYDVTRKQAKHYPYAMQQLWHALCSKPGNVAAIVDFILHRAVEEFQMGTTSPALEFLDVAKRIILFSGQALTQFTVDELMSECAQLVNGGDEVNSNSMGKRSQGDGLARIPCFEKQMDGEKGPAHPAQDGAAMNTACSAARYAVNSFWASGTVNSQHLSSMMGDDSLMMSSAREENLPSALGSVKLSAPASTYGGTTYGTMREHSMHGRKYTQDSALSISDIGGTADVASSGYPIMVRATAPPAFLCRAEIALCMLSELAYQHDEAFRGHLPVLLLICVLRIDADQEIIHQHAHQILVHLVYSMAARNLEAHAGAGGMHEKYSTVGAVIRELQAASPQQLWPPEMTSLLSPHSSTYPVLRRLVRQIVDCMFFEPELSFKWCQEALTWAMHVPSLRLAQRSMHIFRALSPPLNPDICHLLLNALLQCHARPSAASYDFMAEVLIALKEILTRCQPQLIKMYPQIFWGTIALLQTVHVPVFLRVLEVFDAVLSNWQLWNLPCQHILQVSAPAPSHHPAPVAAGILDAPAWTIGCHFSGLPRLSVVQQLLWKGMLHSDTQHATTRVLTSLLHQLTACLRTRGTSNGFSTFESASSRLPTRNRASAPALHGMDHLLGTTSFQIVASLVAGLPWVLVHRHDPRYSAEAIAFCSAAGDACWAYGAAEVSPRLTALAAPHPPDHRSSSSPTGSDSTAALSAQLQNFAAPFVAAFFPTHAALVLTYFTLMLLIGPSEFHPVLLRLIKSIYECKRLSLGEFGRSEAHFNVLQSLMLLLEGNQNAGVLELLDTVLDQLAALGQLQRDPSGRLRDPATGGDGSGALAAAAAPPSGHAAAQDRSSLLFAEPLPMDLIPWHDASTGCAAIVEALQQCLNAMPKPKGGRSGWQDRARFLPFVP